jgi:hypothetical protein
MKYILGIIPIFGIILIVLSCLFFAIAGIQILPWGVMDFPCDPTFTDPIFNRVLNVQPTSRLAYCISYYSRNAGGGGVYASGATDQDEVQAGVISLKRHGEVLYVNNHPIQPNGTYEFVQNSSSYNPWLIFTTRYSLKNEGLTSLGPAQSGNVLYVSGDGEEGFLLNPLGLIILGGGVCLLIFGKRARKAKKINKPWNIPRN